MNEIFSVLHAIPRPFRYLALFFILAPLAFALARLSGLRGREWVFLLGAGVIVLGLWAVSAIAKGREKKKARDFEGNLGIHARSGAGKEEVREAVRELAGRWQTAVSQLREAGLQIYSLPWYLLIGEPQSGKSTTLRNSGLEFPVGADALSGAGGTRNCDWWFSNEAVILDTAGRFTFQEDSAPDQTEWETFLKLLRKHRRDLPINGVIVVIPTTSLLEDMPDELERKAKNIREKLQHVQKVLEIRFPVFVLVTKADRVLGFSEFFMRLDPVEQRQLFGWSNPAAQDAPWDAEGFPSLFEEIVTRVHKLRLRFLREETNPSQIDKLFVFPEELRALAEPLQAYFRVLFRGSRYEEPFLFRGFYVTSGVQQGRPIARACRDLLRVRSGDAAGVLESLESVFQKSRAFFIRDFYEKKLFPEQGLVARSRAALRKQRIQLWVARGIGALAILLLAAGLVPAALNLYRLLKPINQSVAAAQRCVASPCSVKESWGLVSRLEDHRDQLRKRKWTLRFLLRGSEGNELQENLAIVQAKLFGDGVLRPLWASAAERAARLDWRDRSAVYPVFFEALQQTLRAKELRKLAGAEQDAERQRLRIAPLLDLTRRTKGLDGSAVGRELDDWAAGETAPAEAVYVETLRASIASGRLAPPDAAASLAAFESYWTIRHLAVWEQTLIDHLAAFADLHRKLIEAPVVEPLEPSLAAVSATAKAFAANHSAGSAHMISARGAPGAARPGPDLAAWKANARADFDVLIPLSGGALSERHREARLGAIEADWQKLRSDRSLLAYLVSENGGKVSWSKGADGAAGAWTPIAALADLPAFRTTEQKEFEATRQAQTSAADRQAKFDAFLKMQEERGKAVAAGLSALDATSPPPELRAAETRISAERATAAALAARVLPAGTSHYTDLFVGCERYNCYSMGYAKASVPPASAFLKWSAAALGPARGVREVDDGIGKVRQAEFDYLREFVDRERGGGGGGGFSFPGAAASASTWPAFVAAIRRWTPSAGGGEPAPQPGELTVDALQQFAMENDALLPLVADLRRKKAAGGKPVKVADEVIAAATAYRTCVSGLEDDPGKAWRQLANGTDGISRKDFHAFSANPRVRGDQTAQSLRRRVEDHGCELLRKALAPRFAERWKAVVAKIRACCAGRFPFIGRGELERVRREYEGGRLLAERAGAGRDAAYSVDLRTVGLKELEDLYFGRDGADAMLGELAVEPIVAGEEPLIDFLGTHRERVKALLDWDRFVFEAPKAGGGEWSTGGGALRENKIHVRILDRPPSAGRTFLGTRVSLLRIFGSDPIRPSTDAKTRRPPVEFSWKAEERESPQSAVGQNEDKAGWTGRLELVGGSLKVPYFILLSSDGRPANDRTFVSRIVIPDFERKGEKLEGIFEFTFDRALPFIVEAED